MIVITLLMIERIIMVIIMIGKLIINKNNVDNNDDNDNNIPKNKNSYNDDTNNIINIDSDKHLLTTITTTKTLKIIKFVEGMPWVCLGFDHPLRSVQIQRSDLGILMFWGFGFWGFAGPFRHIFGGGGHVGGDRHPVQQRWEADAGRHH